MRIDDSILRTRDFDIFFCHESGGRGKAVHCATFGSLLPEDLNDDDYITYCMDWVGSPSRLLSIEEIVIENENVDHILGANIPEGMLRNDERRNAYVRTFVNMARLGFWSYDRYHSPHSEPIQEDSRFLLIAHPINPIHMESWIPKLRPCSGITLIDSYKSLIR